MIDVHCHCLPGIDDGPETMAEAVALCRAAAADGCVAIVATPHQRRDEWPAVEAARIRDLVAELQAAVGASPRLFVGAEVRVDSDLGSDLARADASGIASLAGSRYLLLEFDPWGLGPDPVELVLELVGAGWRPIVAHPEVTPALVERPGVVERMVQAGAALQLTAASLLGTWGKALRERAQSLVASGLVHLVASDSHDLARRPPGLRQAAAELERRFGAELAQRLIVENPRAIIDGRALAMGAE